MGTHPIFESDFDCLTESFVKKNFRLPYEMSSRERDSRSRSRSRGGRGGRSSSGSPPDRRRGRSRDRSDSRDRYRRSRSRDERRSRSRSRGGRRGRSRSGERRSVSPSRYRKQRHFGDRQEPSRSRCLGVFNLGRRTTEDEFRRIFERYGKLESCTLAYDQKRDESRGFGFVTYEDIEDAIDAKKDATGLDINGHQIRIDYSITKRAHSPTPGVYIGSKGRDGRKGGGRPRDSYRSRDRGRYRSRSRSRGRDYRHRSPSPYRR